MKIAIISYEYPPDTALGGIATYVYQAARMLFSKGNQVELFVASNKSGDTSVEDGIIVHKILSESRDVFKNVVGKRFLERHQVVYFDILEGPDFGADASECIKLVPDIPFTVKLHSPTFIVRELGKVKMGLYPYLRSIASSLIRLRNPIPQKYNYRFDEEYTHILHADVIGAPSLAIAEKVRKGWRLEQKVFDIVPLPFIPSEEYLKVDPYTKTKTILFFGRLEIRKGVVDLVKAIPLVLKKYPDAKFLFIGRPLPSPVAGKDMHEYLTDLLKEYITSVEFIDHVQASEIPQKLAKADICVFPSVWESYGYVCLEAMAAARAVVATDSGGMKEILDYGATGLLVPPKAPKAIAKALIELLSDDNKRVQLGIAARERVKTHYNIDSIYKIHIESYERAIKLKNGDPKTTIR